MTAVREGKFARWKEEITNFHNNFSLKNHCLACYDEITHIHVFKMNLLWWHAQLLASDLEVRWTIIYIYENKIELCKIFIISHLSDIKMQFAFRKFSKKSKREVVVSKAAFYGFSKIACNLNVIYFSIYALKDLLIFWSVCMCSWMQIACYFLRFFLAQQQSKTINTQMEWE